MHTMLYAVYVSITLFVPFHFHFHVSLFGVSVHSGISFVCSIHQKFITTKFWNVTHANCPRSIGSTPQTTNEKMHSKIVFQQSNMHLRTELNRWHSYWSCWGVVLAIRNLFWSLKRQRKKMLWKKHLFQILTQIANQEVNESQIKKFRWVWQNFQPDIGSHSQKMEFDFWLCIRRRHNNTVTTTTTTPSRSTTIARAATDCTNTTN